MSRPARCSFVRQKCSPSRLCRFVYVAPFNRAPPDLDLSRAEAHPFSPLQSSRFASCPSSLSFRPRFTPSSTATSWAPSSAFLCASPRVEATKAPFSSRFTDAHYLPPDSCVIALFETHFDRTRSRDYAALTEEPDEFGDAEEDPEPCRTADEMGDAEEEGLKISTTSFEELKKALPSLTRSVQGEILWEVSSGSCVGVEGARDRS